MKARLTLLDTKHPQPPLRTEFVEGTLLRPLETGRELVLVNGEPLDPRAQVRAVVTSEVQNIDYDHGVVTVHTRNSTYRLEYLDEEGAGDG